MRLSVLILILGIIYIQIFRKDYTHKFRNKIVFVCSAYLPMAMALMNFNKVLPVLAQISSLIVLLNCLSVVFLLSLFRRHIWHSIPHRMGIIFWGYLIIGSFWSEAWLPIFSERIATSFTFFSGLALGHHMLMEKKTDTVFQIMVFSGLILIGIVYFMVLPKLSGQYYVESLTGQVRIGVKGLINPNTVAMVLEPFALIGLIRICLNIGVRHKRPFLIVLLVGGLLFCLSAWLIIRSGSRTGFLSLCIGGITAFSFLAKTKASRMGLGMCFVLVFSWFLLSSGNEYRVLNIRDKSEDLTFSGRMGEWEQGLSTMTDLEFIIGTGGKARISDNGIFWFRFLSVYVTIFHDSGVVGCTLLFLFILSVGFHVLALGITAMPSAAFLSAALIYGFGESGPISPFNIQCLFFGFSVGLLPLKEKSAPLWLLRAKYRGRGYL